MPSVKDTSQTQSNIKYVRARIRGASRAPNSHIPHMSDMCVRARALVYVYRVACGTGAIDGGGVGGGGVAVTTVDLNLKLALRSAELGYASKYLPLPLQCFFFSAAGVGGISVVCFHQLQKSFDVPNAHLS